MPSGSISHDIQRPDDENCHASQQSTADESYERALIRATAAPMIFFPARAHLDHRIKPAAMRVLMSMCWHLNEEFICWPGQNTIAAELGITKQAVCKSIAQLIELGYVEIARRGFRGTGQTNLYRVNIQRHARNLENSPDNSAEFPAENTGNSGTSRTPSGQKKSHSQPHVDSIVNLTLTHNQPQVVQKNTIEEYQGRSSSEGSFHSTSLAQRADSAPPTVEAPPERRTRERLNVSALKRDPLVITLIACFGVEPATPHEWDSWRVAVNDLHTAGVTANDIPRAIRGYQALHPHGRVTPMALARNWSQIREGKSHDLAQLEIHRRSTQAAHDAAAAHQNEHDARRDAERAEVDRLMAEWGYGTRQGEPPRR